MPSNKFLTSVEIDGDETITGSEFITNNLVVSGSLSADNGTFSENVSAVNFYGSGLHLTDVVKNDDGRLTNSRAPSGAAGGDLSGEYPNPTVQKIHGYTVSNATPLNGQLLQWNGTAWVPGAIPEGGSGGGGISYYFNFSTEAQPPTANLASSPNTPKELGTVSSTASSSYTSNHVSTVSYDLVCGFVTLTGVPNAITIPAGLWDFNIWASSTAGTSNQMAFRVFVYKYDGVNNPQLLAESDDINLYDPITTSQYIASVVMPQTTILSSDRVYIELKAKSAQSNKTITLYFGGNTPSHVHTTLPSVGGSGLVKVINGVYQNPASLLVDVDVDSNAEISPSKISGLSGVIDVANSTYNTVYSNSGIWDNTYTTVLNNSGNWTPAYTPARQTKIDVFTTPGTSTWTKPNGAKSVHIVLLGGGGGGGSGRASSTGTAAGGGGGGGGGARTSVTIDASLLNATETVTVGAGGGGGVSRSVGSDGAAGSIGGASSFGLWAYAGQGGGGAGGTSLSGGAAGAIGSRGVWAGGSGGAASISFGAGAAGANVTAGCGGGGGGGVTSGGSAANGGLGGFQFIYNGATAAGTPVGQNGFSVPTNLPYGGSGGGGGNASTLNAAISGGAGGSYGAGGGGGGGSQSFDSGAGGPGASGIVVVTTHF